MQPSYYTPINSSSRLSNPYTAYSTDNFKSHREPAAGYTPEYAKPTSAYPNFNTMSGRTARRYPDTSYDSRYDPRYHYPPPPRSTERTSRQVRRSPERKRRSWPPQPFAEDEASSLSRESNAQQLLKAIDQAEAPRSRGALDQEPVIIDVSDLAEQNEGKADVTASDRGSNSTGIPTPPTSEDERYRKARRKPSKLNVNLSDDVRVPELGKRTASPYAYSKPTRLERYDSSGDRFAPPDLLTPPSATDVKSSRFASSLPSSPRRDSGRMHSNPTRGRNYFDSYSQDNDNALVDDDDDGRRGNKSNSYPSKESSQTSVVDFAGTPLSSNAASIRKLHLDARRNTDTQNTLPTLSRLSAEKPRRLTPLVASTSLSEAQGAPVLPSSTLNPNFASSHLRSRESSYSSSRPVSPAGSTGGASTSSRSPRASAEFSRDGSAHSSKPPSADNSRPPSPSLRAQAESPRVARTELDWSALLAANAARRSTRQPSKLQSSMQQDGSIQSPRTSTHHSRTTSAASNMAYPGAKLPYPADNTFMGSTVFMPEEQEHAYQHHRKVPLIPQFTAEPSSTIPAESPGRSSNNSYPSTRPVRPSLSRGYSAETALQPESRPLEPRPRLADKRTESFATSSATRQELANLMKKGLPPCPRPDPIAGYDDWYTVIGATNIDFCPDCIDTLFERTVFRPHFRRSLPRNLNTKVRCAFGSPWIRLAWLLTLQQQRTDLALLKDLAEIEETTEPCPGSMETVQSWYGLRDVDGLFVRDFHVCFGDVRKIERLLPTLSGIFVRLPHRASYEKRTCAIRTESNRFSTYLDALVSTHEKALMNRKAADPMPLINLIERKTRLRECTRDNMLIGGLWHYIPDIPSMTVCEDCFESVIEPEIKKGSSVAKKFNRTLQPVYGEGIGSSCQLYSRRMRKVFLRATEDGDVKYLARKSKERREAELWLQEKYKDVMRRAKRLSLEGSVSEEEERRLTRDLERIAEEWKTCWE